TAVAIAAVVAACSSSPSATSTPKTTASASTPAAAAPAASPAAASIVQAPVFVDALAAGHRVVAPDNAGVGRTAALPGTLTISAMADQVSALMSALHLG